jgi:glutamyl-tRNA reductase
VEDHIEAEVPVDVSDQAENIEDAHNAEINDIETEVIVQENESESIVAKAEELVEVTIAEHDENNS